MTPYTSASHVYRMVVKDPEGEVLFGPGMHLIIPLEGPLPLPFAVAGSLCFPDSPKMVSFFPRALSSALLRPRPISPTHSHPSCHPPHSHCASQHILVPFLLHFSKFQGAGQGAGSSQVSMPSLLPTPIVLGQVGPVSSSPWGIRKSVCLVSGGGRGIFEWALFCVNIQARVQTAVLASLWI